jgi:hypothetical protein
MIEPKTTLDERVQQAADRFRRGEATAEDCRLIDAKFNEVKWQRIRKLKRQTRQRDRLWT